MPGNIKRARARPLQQKSDVPVNIKKRKNNTHTQTHTGAAALLHKGAATQF